MRLFNKPFFNYCAVSVYIAFSLGMAVSARTPENPAESEITTGILIKEMIDLNRLAEFPNPSYSVFQVSSYDRRSKSFGGENWFANSDGFGKEPLPGVAKILQKPGEDQTGLYLLADVEGPGAIVRTWTARMNGEITMWLDGAEKPLFKGPANDFLKELYPSLDVSGGPVAQIYDGSMTQRDAGYYPVPFAKRCRIEWRGNLDQLHFYHIEFRSYSPDTQVKTFSPSDLITWEKDIQRVCEILRVPSGLDKKIPWFLLRSMKNRSPWQQEKILNWPRLMAVPERSLS